MSAMPPGKREKRVENIPLIIVRYSSPSQVKY